MFKKKGKQQCIVTQKGFQPIVINGLVNYAQTVLPQTSHPSKVQKDGTAKYIPYFTFDNIISDTRKQE